MISLAASRGCRFLPDQEHGLGLDSTIWPIPAASGLDTLAILPEPAIGRDRPRASPASNKLWRQAALTGMVGHFIGRQPLRAGALDGQIIERPAGVIIRDGQQPPFVAAGNAVPGSSVS